MSIISLNVGYGSIYLCKSVQLWFTTDYTEDHFGRVLQNPIESQRIPQDFTFSFMDIPQENDSSLC